MTLAFHLKYSSFSPSADVKPTSRDLSSSFIALAVRVCSLYVYTMMSIVLLNKSSSLAATIVVTKFIAMIGIKSDFVLLFKSGLEITSEPFFNQCSLEMHSSSFFPELK
jgi:hypothetical protein